MLYPNLDKLINESKYEEALAFISTKTDLSLIEMITFEIYKLEIFRKMGKFSEIFTVLPKITQLVLDNNFNLELLKIYTITILSGMRVDKVNEIQNAVSKGDIIAQDIKNDTEEINLVKSDFFNSVGIYNVRHGKHSAAINNFETSLKLREESYDRTKYYQTLQNLAQTYNSNGDFNKARELFEKCVLFFQSQNDEYRAAYVLHNISTIDMAQGNFVHALRTLKGVTETFRRFNDTQSEANTLTNISNCYLELNEIDQAILAIEESLKINKELGNSYEIALCYHNLGNLKHSKNEFQKALEYLTKSLDISISSKFLILGAISIVIKVKIYIQLGRQDQAFDIYSIFEKLSTDSDNKVIEGLREIAFSLILSSRVDLTDKLKAKEILLRYIEFEGFNYQIYVFIVFELTSLIFYEFRLTRNNRLLIEIEKLVQRLLSFSDKNKLFRIKMQTLLIASQLELLRFNFIESRKYIDESYKLGVNYGSLKLSYLISNFYDNLLGVISEIMTNQAITNNLDLNQLNELELLIEEGRQQKAISIDIELEIPLFFMIFDRKNKTILFNVELNKTKDFEKLFTINIVHHISEFFQHETQTKNTERVHINSHSVLFQLNPEIGYAYIFTGKSFSALHKLEALISYLSAFIKTNNIQTLLNHKQEIYETCFSIFSRDFGSNEDSPMKSELIKTLFVEQNFENFKNILHPIRLSIVSLLFKHFEIPRNDLLKVLNINSGNLNNHLNVLKGEQLIGERTEFIDAKPRKIITIEPKGMSLYMLFQDWTKRN